jgi:hypothetical protein
MKKLLFTMLALVLAIGLSIPMAIPVAAAPDTMTVVSDDSGATVITTVYNKAGGVNNTVDLSGSPLTAVRAWEPDPYSSTYPTEPSEATDSTWDNGVNWFENNLSAADWIWETHIAEGPASYGILDPLYDADAARYGRVVLFETDFNIPGNPTSATLYIAADNGYEAWVNSGTHYRSPTAAAGWETSNLHQAWLNTSGWQSYGTHVISGSELVNGSNTLYVLAGNEYFWSDDSPNFDNPTQGTWPGPSYNQYNPGAAIYQLDIEYEAFVAAPGIKVVKSGAPTSTTENTDINYTYTVTNTGNVPLSSIAVSDDLVSPVTYQSGDDGDGILQTTETWIYTGSYHVPWFTAGPVVNTVTAEGYWETTKVTDDDDFSVDILHNPDIEVTKSGPASPNFQTVDPADYFYAVTNTGNCALEVTLEDDVYGVLTPIDGDTYLLPSQTWHYEVSDELICDGYTMTIFTNTATAEGEDATGTMVFDGACWTVMVFQWQPRTIGYWGNWSNHYSDTEMSALVTAVNGNSAYFDGPGPTLTAASVRSLLLATDQTGKMTADKARTLLVKQLIATWFNVKSYMDWDGSEPIDNFVGSADTAMDPNATVYVDGSVTTVSNLLQRIEWNLVHGTTDVQFLLKAKDILDKMNNAENNHYMMFMDPAFDPGACLLQLRHNPPSKNVPAPGEEVTGFVCMHANHEDNKVVVSVVLEAGAPSCTYGVFLETYNGLTGGPANWLSWAHLGNMTTNSSGSGTFSVSVPRSPGVYYLQIVVSYPWGSWGAQSFGTDIAKITIE